MVALASFNVSKNPVLKIEGGEIQGIPTETLGVYIYKGMIYSGRI